MAPGDIESSRIPIHEWGLSSLFQSYVKLLCCQVQELLLGECQMSLPGGMKIKKAQIAGRVVYWKKHNLRNGSSFVKLAVDDCTGVVYTHTWLDGEGSGKRRNTTSPYSNVLRISIGDPVIVHGLLKVYNRRQELMVDGIRKCSNPNEPLLHTLEAMELTLLQYQQPFQRDNRVTDSDVTNALRLHPFPCQCDAPYSRTLGYCACHCQLLGKRDTVYLKFMDSLLKLLADWELRLPSGETLHFTFKALLVDLTLYAAAKEHHLELKSALRKVLSVLRQDGVIVLRDEVADIYVLVSWDRWLCPLLANVIQELGNGQNTHTIIKFVQKKEPWVTGGRIRACLDAMAASPTGQPSSRA